MKKKTDFTKTDFNRKEYLRSKIKATSTNKRRGVEVSFNLMSKKELKALKAALDILLVKKVTLPASPEVEALDQEAICNIISALSDAGIDEHIRRMWGY